MVRNIIIQRISVAIVVIGITFSFYSTKIYNTYSTIGFIGTVLGAIGGLYSLTTKTEHTEEFNDDDWLLNQTGAFHLELPRSLHKLGKLTVVTIYLKNLTGYELAIINTHFNENGDITLEGCKPVTGKILIK